MLNGGADRPGPRTTFYLPFNAPLNCSPARSWPAAGNRPAPTSAASIRASIRRFDRESAAVVSSTAIAPFPGWWAILPVAGAAPAGGARVLVPPHRAREPAAGLDRSDQLPLPLLALWPLLVCFAIVKSGPLSLLERELILVAERAAGVGDLSVRRGANSIWSPSPRKMSCAVRGHGAGPWPGPPSCAAVALIFDCRPEIRAMTRCADSESFRWRFHGCLLDQPRNVICR